jgi:hypothetical protein
LEGLAMEDDVFMGILSNLRPNGIFYAHFIHFVVIWYIFPRFGMLYREKFGNPGRWSVSHCKLAPGPGVDFMKQLRPKFYG